MATIDVEPRPRRARGLAVLSLAVVAGGIALVATRGVLPLDESIQGRLGELALGARERLGTRGVLTFIFDAFFHIAFDAAIGVVAIAQGLLALFLVLSSVAVLWGDWISLWSMRRWAAIALGVECLN